MSYYTLSNTLCQITLCQITLCCVILPKRQEKNAIQVCYMRLLGSRVHWKDTNSNKK